MNKLLSIVCLAILALSVAEARESRARQNFYCHEAINNQIKMEFDASQNYLSLANYFGSDLVALDGFAHMFEHSWKEEISHGQKLISYMIKRGATVVTPQVSRPENDTEWSKMNACEIIEVVLGLEMKVHDSLLRVHKCASGLYGASQFSEDPHLQDFIESEYLTEQVDANKELADLLTKLERTTLHRNADGSKMSLCDGLGLHMIDNELNAKFNK